MISRDIKRPQCFAGRGGPINRESAALPLTSDISRIRGIYKLLPLRYPLRVLEIIAANEASIFFGGEPFEGTRVISATIDKINYGSVDYTNAKTHTFDYLFDASNALNAYDLIVMHCTISSLKRSLPIADKPITNEDIFEHLSRLLTKSGILAGCIRNSRSVQKLLPKNSNSLERPCLSFSQLRKLVHINGLANQHIFSIYPGANSPISLAEVNLVRSIRHSRAQLGYLKNWLGRANYRLKYALSFFGVSLWFDEQYFFYAQKR